jgi:hypothetical protein
MNTILEHIHNIMRWAVLLFGLLSIASGARGMGGGRDFTAGDRRNALFFMISCDIQLVLGLALYFTKGYYNNFSGGGAVMRDSVMRYWTVEHLVGMILGIILVHIGYSGTKGDRRDNVKFRRLFWCSLIAMIIFLAMIPWPFRIPGIAQPWFPGA